MYELVLRDTWLGDGASTKQIVGAFRQHGATRKVMAAVATYEPECAGVDDI
jgi:hypothetical protein